MVGIGLGIELVGIADNLLLQGLWFPTWQTGTRMALSNTGMAGKTCLTQQGATYLSVTDIGLRAVTMNGGGITLEDTYIVQHGCFL